MVESQPSKLLVAGSIPVSRSIFSISCSDSDTSRLLLNPVMSVSMRCKLLKPKAPARMINSPEHCDSSAPRKFLPLRSRRGAIAFEVRIDILGDAIDDLLFMVLIANIVCLP